MSLYRYVLSLLLLLGASELASGKGCNKTIRTTRAIQSPRLTRLNRNQPMTCFYKFVSYADPNNPGVFEITFRSLHIGRQVNNSLCRKGYLRIEDDRLREGHAGYICGRIRKSRIYLAHSEVVTLMFYAERFTRHTFFKAHSSMLPAQFAKERHKELAVKSPGKQIHGTYCDRLFLNCDGLCDVTSPGYPGFYPRNVTCRYEIVFNTTDTRVTIGGHYYDKFDVWGTKGFRGNRILNYCPYDFLRIYDGEEQDSPMIGTFCGRGILPRIVSRNPKIVMEFVSSPAGSMISDGFYLSVGKERRLPGRPGQEIMNPSCQWKFISTQVSQGYLYSLRHWYPPRTRCTYRLIGRPGEKLWVHFISFNVLRGSQCRNVLRIFNSSWQNRSALVGEYCGKNRPNETLLSLSEKLFIEYESMEGSFDGSQFEYSVYFMFLNTTSPDSRVPNTLCDQLFMSEQASSGYFHVLPNRLVLRNSEVQCKVQFMGKPSERVRLTLQEVKFNPLRQCVGIREPICTKSDFELTDHLSVIDSDGSHLGCFCADLSRDFQMVSSGSKLSVELKLYQLHYLAHRMDKSFVFTGHYQFLQVGCGEFSHKGIQGELNFPLEFSKTQKDFHCRWKIETSPGSSVMIKLPHVALSSNCSLTSLKMFTAVDLSLLHEFCGNHTNIELFPPTWQKKKITGRNENVVILELVSSFKYVQFQLLWTELWHHEDPEHHCDHLCPDNISCISKSLLCNGVINCPETNFYGNPLDEASSLCHQKNYIIQSILGVSAVSIILLTVSCLVMYVWHRQTLTNKDTFTNCNNN
ncbi:dorsal-ventral patterning protein tolloid-like [Tachypleus tridentatus]|uniref:dorsal-ventral patterning protein tolloid-like n=1 Tax=Tachypleus tridentatus TaxID=6853 RepID=UPI003FD5C3DC